MQWLTLSGGVDKRDRTHARTTPGSSTPRGAILAAKALVWSGRHVYLVHLRKGITLGVPLLPRTSTLAGMWYCCKQSGVPVGGQVHCPLWNTTHLLPY